MRIDKLEINNFRCFEHLDLEMHPRLNVFVGVNGSGKTALVEAIRTVLGPFLNETGVPDSPKLDTRKDPLIQFYRQNKEISKEVELVCRALLYNQPIEWSTGLAWKNRRFRQTNMLQKLKDSIAVIDQMRQRNDPIELPLIAYYSAERDFERKDTGVRIEAYGSRLQGYFNALNDSYIWRVFEQWFSTQEYALYQEKTHGLDSGNGFETVKKLIVQFVPGAKTIFYHPGRKEILIGFGDDDFKPVSYLSAGFRKLLLMISDLALRCYTLNPELENQLGKKINEANGVVIIDEIDLHLHPSWQRIVIDRFHKTFPNIQFFFTTHSPQVLSQVSKESVFLLKNAQVESGVVFTEGRDSNSILEDVFEVPELEEKYKKEIHFIYDLIDGGKKDQAEKMLKKLLLKRGEKDREVQRIISYLEFL